ncbi:pleiotropic ABC efflux transporter of multiple drugs Cdr1p [[Candida] jaroonii]|uniref:Pleiotropic ABC efflux transporter of multiple drugs Cdr1p n=1 Tax=[Candida] jaroonii TaxID=467808 RepID=A0ACA9Y5P0_9ASCO|nr:pleiotropic ABC efflux transporter of multiple drugs Cdr1p [[Candida] jaroonii]
MSSKEEEMDYRGFTDEVAEEIKDIVRQYSHDEPGDNSLALQRTLSHMSQIPGVNPFTGNEVDPRLDPECDEFDSKFWVKNLRKYMDTDADYFKPSKLGVAFKDLRCYGTAVDSDYQANFANGVYKNLSNMITDFTRNGEDGFFDILKPMEGLLKPGELTVVLGRPGAGCSTFLKTIATQTHGFHVDPQSLISYDGLTPEEISTHYRGDVIYCAETEHHFPQLAVGDTLEFAARMRTPHNRGDVDRERYAKHLAAVYMATYGLSHTRYTKVGNDFIRGVSGGERKRVSIAEAAISQSKIQCWDNSTRGLDSATAYEFINALKTSASVQETTPLVAIYQCSQDAYDIFDNVVLLYEGYEIFFGKTTVAKKFFEDMGYQCAERQTTADFLTSLSNPAERIVKQGYEKRVPRTPIEFYQYWRNSSLRQDLLTEIDQYLRVAPENNDIKENHRAKQSTKSRPASPYVVSYGMQVKYILHRNWLRLKADPSITLFSAIGNSIMALITASIFYNLKPTTESFSHRASALFFATLFNAFASILEIFSLYEARPIVEKHKTYALYHPSADAFASIITELPNKLITGIIFNLIIYFMVNLKRSPGPFFFFLLIALSATITMSHIFRTIGAATKTLYEAMTPASLILTSLILFTGFVVPTPNMLGWCRWINYINPIAYTFEALMANEFHGREFECSQYIPSGPGFPTTATGNTNVACSVVGGALGENMVSGDRYIALSYQYYYSHVWRNFGITIGFMVFFLLTYIVLCEFNKGAMQKGEILLFQRSALKKEKNLASSSDLESGDYEKTPVQYENSDDDQKLIRNTNIFHWRNITYEVKIKSETRVILDDVDGWVKPGQVTALMGASGAGKTTLLNALSERLTSGVITSGTRMVNGNSLDSSFQRSIGYVQQQDLHLTTSTVREALTFSAYLRQPNHVSKKEKDDYVEYIIKLLEMERYSDAVVGVAGEGLNVEQRKRLTIGVELVAKPKLLVFLDEPTSGLDSQTAWSICKLIRKLADHGEAILCTIHQPSAILLQEFDRLLFLQKGGQTVYFGELGKNCSTLIDYFEKHGAPKCPPQANPAEWMLQVIGAAPGSHAKQNYYEVWKQSNEYQDVQKELSYMENELVKLPKDESAENLKTFATPIFKQYLIVTKRLFEQYWRTNAYLYSKFSMAILTSLFNGFVFFKADRSLQGMTNQMFSIFMFISVFGTYVQQYLPLFISQREIYEVRESPSRTFSWIAFMAAQITTEIPWDIVCGTVAFFCWYYPVGLYENAVPTDTVTERGAFMWWMMVLYYIYNSSMAQLVVSFNELETNAANLANLFFSMCLMFCGVLASSDTMPRFWIFMYRFNPMTYFVSAVLSTGLADSTVTCSKRELVLFNPFDGQTCYEYVGKFANSTGGNLLNPQATSSCEFCTLSTTNQFLDQVNSSLSTRFRDMGVFIGFIVFDWVLACFFYWLTRVPKRSREKKK